MIGGNNPFVALKRLVAQPGQTLATVDAVHGDGTVTATVRGATAAQRLRTSFAPNVGATVVVQGGVVVGVAPSATAVTIDV